MHNKLRFALPMLPSLFLLFSQRTWLSKKGWHIPLMLKSPEIFQASWRLNVHGHAMEVSPSDILVWICIQRGSLLLGACRACLWRTP